MTRFSFLVMAGLAVAACDRRPPEAVALDLAKPAITQLTGRADPEVAMPLMGIDDQGYVNLCGRTDSMDGGIPVEVTFMAPAQAFPALDGDAYGSAYNSPRCGRIQRWRWAQWAVERPAAVRSAIVDGTALPEVNTAAERTQFARAEKAELVAAK